MRVYGDFPAENRKVRLTYVDSSQPQLKITQVTFENNSIGHVDNFDFQRNQGDHHSLIYFLLNQQTKEGEVVLHRLVKKKG